MLQKQFRPPVDGVCIEIPAGLLDPNESLETCAERELFEETGYVGKAVQSSPVMYNDPGFCNTNLKLVTVSVDLNDPRNQNPTPHLEDGEFIESFTGMCVDVSSRGNLLTTQVPLKTFPEEMRRLADQGFKLDARLQNVAVGLELAQQYSL